MALSPERKQIRRKELKIGRIAAEMATQYLHKNINRSFDVKNKGGIFNGKTIEPMIEASKVKAKMGEHFLLGLDATSNRYSFMHHYGFKGAREPSFVRYNHSRFTAEFTNRSSHPLVLKERSIFKDLYIKSGAITYLQEQLSETRSEAFQAKFNDLVVKLSQDEE